MKIILCGRGKLAQAIEEVAREQNPPVKVEYFHQEVETTPQSMMDAVGIHCGSGKDLNRFLEFCGKFSVRVIQASTGQTLPEHLDTVVVNAPNLAIPIVELLGTLGPVLDRLIDYAEMQAGVIESHQATKTSTPGTAKEFARLARVAPEKIVSVRSDALQRVLGVPSGHLERHGHHWIVLEGGGVTIKIETEVNGLRPYALGALHYAKFLSKNSLQPGLYQVTDLP